MKRKDNLVPLQLAVLWHWWRLGRNWNRMIAIAANSEYRHIVLMQVCPAYRLASLRYNESKRYLVAHGRYITAESIMKAKRQPT